MKNEQKNILKYLLVFKFRKLIFNAPITAAADGIPIFFIFFYFCIFFSEKMVQIVFWKNTKKKKKKKNRRLSAIIVLCTLKVKG